MQITRSAAALAVAMLLLGPSAAAHATPLPQHDGRECVMYNGQVVYCIDY
jgi:hypothetical protein